MSADIHLSLLPALLGVDDSRIIAESCSCYHDPYSDEVGPQTESQKNLAS